MALYENPWGETAAERPQPRRLGGRPPKLSERIKEAFARTKRAASGGIEKTKKAAKKVKKGASKGWFWIKLRYQKHKPLQLRNKGYEYDY